MWEGIYVMGKLLNINMNTCPECGSKRFIYHTKEERQQKYVGKYECVSCHWQSGGNGEMEGLKR